MQAHSETTFQKPSALQIAERHALVGYLFSVAADLAHRLAIDGFIALVKDMLDIKHALRRMGDDMSGMHPGAFDNQIGSIVNEIRKARQRLGDCPAYMTIQ